VLVVSSSWGKTSGFVQNEQANAPFLSTALFPGIYDSLPPLEPPEFAPKLPPGVKKSERAVSATTPDIIARYSENFELWENEVATTSIEYLLEFYAEKYDLSSSTIPVLKTIIQLESNGEMTATNELSGACGLAQFLESTWEETWKRRGISSPPDCKNPIFNIDAFVWLYKEDGIKHWCADKKMVYWLDQRGIECPAP
jgi:hypothetical protein